MGSSARRDDSSQRAIEGDLVDAGNRLLNLPSSSDEFLIHVERVESLLAKVWQQPPKFICKAVYQIMLALITDKVLHHDDVNVQVAVASCFNEFTRITAPKLPYADEIMVEFFRLFMIAFNQLSCESGPNYSRALQILETMANVRSSLLLMDIDDGLIFEMFRIFLNTIRSNHPSDVYQHMEMIMTLVIEESDEISIELLKPLLASVKMDNKNTSPISWELGKKVFENCAAKLQSSLREAVNAMNLDLDDYAEIVTSICHDTSHGNNMVPEEAALTVGDGASPSNGLPKAVNEDSDPKTDDGNGTKLDKEHSMETDTGALRRRRGRKPNSVIRPEEGYEHVWVTGGKYSGKVFSDGYNDEKKDLSLPLGLGSGSTQSGSSHKKSDSPNEESLLKSKKKKSTTNADNDLEFSSKRKRKILQGKVKERNHNAPEKTGKRDIAGSSKSREEQSASKESVQKDMAHKMEELSTSKSAKGKFPRKDKEKKSRKSRVGRGEELVNLRIQVWWPMDETFYAGTIEAFDAATDKHTILYDDGETEILNLSEEIWKVCVKQPLQLFTKPSQKQETDGPSPAKELVKTQEKTAKRKAGSSTKQHATLSSKRSKSENRSVIKSGDNSALEIIIHMDDESGDDAREKNVSTKDDGEDNAGKEKSETSMKKMEGGHISDGVTKD